MLYLETHDEIANSIGRDLTGIRSENTMKEVFYRLNRRKLLERVPGSEETRQPGENSPVAAKMR